MSYALHIGSDTYRMDVFPLPATEETNPMPLDIAIGGGKAWVSCEFDRRIYSVPVGGTDGTAMSAIEIPGPSAPAIFRTLVMGGDLPSAMSQCEDIDVDPAGNVWVAQRGASPYSGTETNRSRVLRYSPATGQWRAFPLPWNNPGATAVLIDGARVWATCGEPNTGPALCVTRPLSWSTEDTDPTAAPSTSLQASEFGGWRCTPMADAWPAHMAIGGDGRLYVANYFGNSVTAIHRTTFAVQTYALPAGSTGPWQIAFDLGGGCWVTCDATRQLAKLNPAAGTWTVYPTGLPAAECLHSLVLDAGAFWFTAYTASTGGRIGRRTSAGVMELSETLDTFGLAMGAAGCAIESGRLWVCLFGSQAVGRLTKL